MEKGKLTCTLTVCLEPEEDARKYYRNAFWDDLYIRYSKRGDNGFHSWDSRFEDTKTFVGEINGGEINFITLPRYEANLDNPPEGTHVFSTSEECDEVVRTLVEKYHVHTVAMHEFKDGRPVSHCVLYPNYVYHENDNIQPSYLTETVSDYMRRKNHVTNDDEW